MTKNQQILAKMGGGSLALLLSLGLGQQASATTLVSNLPDTTTSEYEPPVTFAQWVRSSFTTGSASYGYTLNSVTLRFRELTPDVNLFVRLYRDNAGALGSQMTSFTNPGSFTTALDNNNFTATPQTLDANTTYWLVAGISSTGSGEYRWASTTSPDQTGFTGWSIGGNSFGTTNQGTSWSSFINFQAFQFSVNGTENPPPTPPTNIPEPGSAVALLGLGGLGLASRMKKLSTRA
ncbi:PEP-CTERM protein-sorting domain-containing protein [Microcystis aeruginosa]